MRGPLCFISCDEQQLYIQEISLQITHLSGRSLCNKACAAVPAAARCRATDSHRQSAEALDAMILHLEGMPAESRCCHLLAACRAVHADGLHV